MFIHSTEKHKTVKYELGPSILNILGGKSQRDRCWSHLCIKKKISICIFLQVNKWENYYKSLSLVEEWNATVFTLQCMCIFFYCLYLLQRGLMHVLWYSFLKESEWKILLTYRFHQVLGGSRDSDKEAKGCGKFLTGESVEETGHIVSE